MSALFTEDHVAKAIQLAVHKEVSTTMDAVLAKAQAELAQKVQRCVAEIAVSIFKMYDIRRMGDDIVIKVRHVTEEHKE